MTQPNAQTKMKAMVAARFLMGDFERWEAFERERQMATNISNRQVARSVSAQIGRSYKELTRETDKFIKENFVNCNVVDLAKLCDAMPPAGIYMRLDEFSHHFFPLTERIMRQHPFHAHVSITCWGLQFEYPEHHFLRDLESALRGLEEGAPDIAEFKLGKRDARQEQQILADFVAMERFMSRSMISASYSLLEAFLSGIFYEAAQRNTVGPLACDSDFVQYAKTKESEAFARRLDRLVNFASGGCASSDADPFKECTEFGKRFRDAIHHTTPFERKGLRAGDRLLALYSIERTVALRITLAACDSIIKINEWIYGAGYATAVSEQCGAVRQRAAKLFDNNTSARMMGSAGG